MIFNKLNIRLINSNSQILLRNFYLHSKMSSDFASKFKNTFKFLL
jgi:hypothetical protein